MTRAMTIGLMTAMRHTITAVFALLVAFTIAQPALAADKGDTENGAGVTRPGDNGAWNGQGGNAEDDDAGDADDDDEDEDEAEDDDD